MIPDPDVEPKAAVEWGEDVERVGLLVPDRCENLIRELLSYKEEHVGTPQAVDHCADSLRYACMGAGGARSGGSAGSSPDYFEIDMS